MEINQTKSIGGKNRRNILKNVRKFVFLVLSKLKESSSLINCHEHLRKTTETFIRAAETPRSVREPRIKSTKNGLS